MYSVQFCWEDCSKVVAVFEDKGLAIEYANFKRRANPTIFYEKPIAIEVLNGDKAVSRIFVD